MSESSFQFTALLEADALADVGTPGNLLVVASFSERQKSRHKTQTQCGKPVGWFFPRGLVLKEGDVLLCRSGEILAIQAAPEDCSQVSSSDALKLMTAAYHLGNRHVPLQIGPGLLRYQRDHVLDAMLEGLGLEVQHVLLPFQPEPGAYHGKSILQIDGGHHH